MVSDDEVRAALLEFVQRHISVGFTGNVTNNSRAESEGVVEVEYNEMTFEARIRAVSGETDQGLRAIPAVGSTVFCVSEGNSDNSLVAVAATSLESWALGIGDITVMVDNKGVVFNGGSLGGAVIVGKMVEWMQKVHSDLTTLQALLASSPVVGNGSPLGIAFTPSTPMPQAADFEDKKLTH